jgi:hypothetical protein
MILGGLRRGLAGVEGKYGLMNVEKGTRPKLEKEHDLSLLSPCPV